VVLVATSMLPSGFGGGVGQGLIVAATTTALSMAVAALALRGAQWSEDHLPRVEIDFGRRPPAVPPPPPPTVRQNPVAKVQRA
jgi:hypothetical protein